jgi:bifunctional damage-control phosphatase, subfamily II, fusion protein
MALCRMVSYNIGHLAYLNAKRYGISRVFFGGFFTRGHLYTMNVISFAIRFWSKGEMSALFLRHEGFLGAMGAFLKGHPLEAPLESKMGGSAQAQTPSHLTSHFVERYPMGAPFAGGTIDGPPFSTLSEKVSWVERFVTVRPLRTCFCFWQFY